MCSKICLFHETFPHPLQQSFSSFWFAITPYCCQCQHCTHVLLLLPHCELHESRTCICISWMDVNLLYRVWGTDYAMESYILEIALDLILTLHPAFMASLVGNSIVIIIQTFPPSCPVHIPVQTWGNHSWKASGLGSQELLLSCAQSLNVQLCPERVCASPKPVLVEDRRSSHPLPAHLLSIQALVSSPGSWEGEDYRTKGHENSLAFSEIPSTLLYCFALFLTAPTSYIIPLFQFSEYPTKKERKKTLWRQLPLLSLH